MKVGLEIIAVGASDAVAAQAGGADRIELVSAMSEGGLSPDRDTVREVLKAVSIPVHVMVRPHSRSFCYDDSDLRVMAEEISAVRRLGAAGIVVGALTSEGAVDERAMRILLAEAEGMAVTFHRAFDESNDLLQSFQTISEFPGVNRILTSGGARTALQGIEHIKQLVSQSKTSPITILAGSGLSVTNLKPFIEESGVEEVHLGSGVRIQQNFAYSIDHETLVLATQICSEIHYPTTLGAKTCSKQNPSWKQD